MPETTGVLRRFAGAHSKVTGVSEEASSGSENSLAKLASVTVPQTVSISPSKSPDSKFLSFAELLSPAGFTVLARKIVTLK